MDGVMPVPRLTCFGWEKVLRSVANKGRIRIDTHYELDLWPIWQLPPHPCLRQAYSLVQRDCNGIVGQNTAVNVCAAA